MKSIKEQACLLPAGRDEAVHVGGVDLGEGGRVLGHLLGQLKGALILFAIVYYLLSCCLVVLVCLF